jgi:hypothetical protein
MLLRYDITQWVLVATALLSGLISGQMLAIGIANWAARGSPEISWTLRFQLENKSFTKTMPPALIGPKVGIIGALFFVQGRAFPFMVASAFLTGVVLVITMACNTVLAGCVRSAHKSKRMCEGWLRLFQEPVGCEVGD